MHYLGVVTEQLSHDDAQVVVARRHARQRRDARREARVVQPVATTPVTPVTPVTPTAWRTPAKGKHVGPRHLRSWTWRGVLAHHH